MELALNQRHLAGQNVAVNVIEKVQAEQQREGAQGGVDVRANCLSRLSQCALFLKKKGENSQISRPVDYRPKFDFEIHRRSDLWPGPSRLDDRANSAAGTELPSHCGPDRIAGLDHVFQHLVDDVFLKNSKIPVI